MALRWCRLNWYNMNQITRETYKVDAEGQILGRMAVDIAIHLIGKHRPDFQKHIDAGDVVEVTNVDKMVVTGKKLDQKEYFHHTQYPGGIKSKSMGVLMKENPAEVLRKSVSRMLPKNKHREERINRLKIS